MAAATVCALLGMECVVYMGSTDVRRQHVNVERMKMLGAEVVPVTSGNMTLKDATNEAIRDWCCHPSDTHYIIGSALGQHPYPDMVARLQSVISEEIKAQLLEHEGREYPDWLVVCVGGGSNASGTVYHYLDDSRVKIVLAEAGGKGVDSGMTAATIYMVSSASVTGGRKDFAGDRLEYFRRIAGMGLRNPRMIGFRISSQRTWQAAAENASGGIVGSLFVQLLEEASGDADKAVRRLKTLLYGPSAFPDGYML